MAAFLEIVFPVKIGLGATGGPQRKTQVVQSGSGKEERNQQWANSRRSWDVGTGIRDIYEAEQVLSFFEDVRGRLSGFLFCDPFDLRSCAILGNPSATDQAIGTGDGATTAFQLTKTYGSANPYMRKISKPKQDSVLVAVDGVALDAADFSVDHTTGLVTLADPPAVDAAVTAGFEFYVPVRFDTDDLSIAWENNALISVPSIPVLELIL
ncbi:TIGR02217 family protein [Cohaesibacter marisflavi]|uniref:TIGR02217 family protein n=1 Tax=Cohaesibacter marisflavi TaxID=655353 RepID=A0A1I5AEA5_9HYPH|nr:DUF2460 domain-containing protein [Cohaesibacter marisflavi]SFN60784.1 TIGR02217 family protein [Cohaesibacter marisflavi]